MPEMIKELNAEWPEHDGHNLFDASRERITC